MKTALLQPWQYVWKHYVGEIVKNQSIEFKQMVIGSSVELRYAFWNPVLQEKIAGWPNRFSQRAPQNNHPHVAYFVYAI